MDHYSAYVFELNRSRDTAHAVVILYNVYRGPVPGTPYLRGTHEADGVPNREFANSRLPLFFDYTLRSLQNQGSDNFFIVFMYEGRTEFRDTTPGEVAARARATLDVPFELAPISPIDFTRDYDRSFWQRRTSEEQAILKHAAGKSELLITYLDGDDLLHEDYVETMQAKTSPRTQVLCVPRGFMYSSATGRVRPWERRPPHQPPFFTLRYDAAAFAQGQRLYGGPGRHLYVARHLSHRVLDERLFAQHVHSRNDSTAYAAPEHHPDLDAASSAVVLATMGLPTGAGLQSARRSLRTTNSRSMI